VADGDHPAGRAVEFVFVDAIDDADAGFVVGGNMNLGVRWELLDALPIGSGWGLPQGSYGCQQTTKG
jgi:hypothetical protein